MGRVVSVEGRRSTRALGRPGVDLHPPIASDELSSLTRNQPEECSNSRKGSASVRYGYVPQNVR